MDGAGHFSLGPGSNPGRSGENLSFRTTSLQCPTGTARPPDRIMNHCAPDPSGPGGGAASRPVPGRGFGEERQQRAVRARSALDDGEGGGGGAGGISIFLSPRQALQRLSRTGHPTARAARAPHALRGTRILGPSPRAIRSSDPRSRSPAPGDPEVPFREQEGPRPPVPGCPPHSRVQEVTSRRPSKKEEGKKHEQKLGGGGEGGGGKGERWRRSWRSCWRRRGWGSR